MTKKKRSAPTLESVLARPWCYYCERDFDDLKVLMQHQKAKHFKCANCSRRLNTAGGLVVHMTQVHKEELQQVENALPARTNPHIEIFGMEGIPEEALQAHNYRMAQSYEAEQSDRQIATGNPPRGAGAGENGNVSKKPKLESITDLKARLAAHKAAKAAEAAGLTNKSVDSGNSTPAGATDQTTQQFQPPPQSTPQHFNAFAPPPGMPFQQQQQQAPPGLQLPQQLPHQHLGPPPGMLNNYNQYHDYAQSGQNMQPRAPVSEYTPALVHLPPAPGLPPRPAFVPSVSPGQMQQFHHGQSISPAPAPSYTQQLQSPSTLPPYGATLGGQAPYTTLASIGLDGNNSKPSITEQTIIHTQAASEVLVQKHAGNASSEARAVLDTQGFVYNDNEVSPEEKMALMSKYKW